MRCKSQEVVKSNLINIKFKYRNTTVTMTGWLQSLVFFKGASSKKMSRAFGGSACFLTFMYLYTVSNIFLLFIVFYISNLSFYLDVVKAFFLVLCFLFYELIIKGKFPIVNKAGNGHGLGGACRNYPTKEIEMTKNYNKTKQKKTT